MPSTRHEKLMKNAAETKKQRRWRFLQRVFRDREQRPTTSQTALRGT